MFGIGSAELLLILLAALIALGPKNLAGFSRALGKFMGEIRKVSTDFQRALNLEAAETEMKEAEKKRKLQNQERTAPSASVIQENHNNDDLPNSAANTSEDTPLARAMANAKCQADQAAKANAQQQAGNS